MSRGLALVVLPGACTGAAPRPADPTEFNAGFGEARPTQVGRYRIALQLEPDPPPLGELFQVHAVVTLDDGTPVETGKLSLNARMPKHDHGMETLPKVRPGACVTADTDAPPVCRHPGGRYTADGFKFHMGGDWTVMVDVDGPAGPDSTTFVYRMP